MGAYELVDAGRNDVLSPGVDVEREPHHVSLEPYGYRWFRVGAMPDTIRRVSR